MELILIVLGISIIFDAFLYHHFTNFFEAQFELTDRLIKMIKHEEVVPEAQEEEE